MCYLQQQKVVWSVRPWRNGSACDLYLQQQKLVWSVRRIKFRPTFLIYLQQQKLVWSVRRIEITKRVIINLQQQKLVWSVRPPVYIGLPFILSTIVEISVVCQTVQSPTYYLLKSTIVEISVVCQTRNQRVNHQRLIYNSRNQCGLLDCIARWL